MKFDDKLKSAGVYPRHVSHLLGISRVAASNWYNTSTEPHPLLTDKAELLLSAAAAALEAGELPPPEDISRAEINHYVIRVLKGRMLDLAEARL